MKGICLHLANCKFAKIEATPSTYGKMQDTC